MQNLFKEKTTIKGGHLKYSKDYKIYAIIYMLANHLSNKEATKMFLPHQKSNDTKTIRSWKKIYKEKGVLGFFNMSNKKSVPEKTNESKSVPKIIKDKAVLESLSKEELLKQNYYLQLKIDVLEEMKQLLEKKNN